MSWGWLWRRLVSLGVVLLLVSMVTYLLIDLLPGDPATAVLGPGATPETIEIVRQRPPPRRSAPGAVRRVARAGGAGRPRRVVPDRRGGHGGDCVSGSEPRSSCSALTQLVAIAVAVPAALLSARRERGRARSVAVVRCRSSPSPCPSSRSASPCWSCSPRGLQWFPVAQYVPLGENVFGNLHAMVLPVVTLAVPLAGIYYRVLRTDLMQTLRSDHITFARAMGLSPRRVLLGRALRPSSLTLVSVIGLNTAFLLGGAAIVERLFYLPGLGAFMTEARADPGRRQGAGRRARCRLGLRDRQPRCRSVAHAVRSPCPAGPEGGMKLAGPRQLQTRYGSGGALALGVVGAADVLAPASVRRCRSRDDRTSRASASGPGWPHLLGTDNRGVDMIVRLIDGCRISLVIGVGGVADRTGGRARPSGSSPATGGAVSIGSSWWSSTSSPRSRRSWRPRRRR